jgi:hypothetical protein
VLFRRRKLRPRQADLNSAATLQLLNGRLIGGFGGETQSGTPTIVRTSMPPGKSSPFLNRIDLGREGESATRLVEKAVLNDSAELLFWRESTWPNPILSGGTYNAVRPVDLYMGDSASVLYFPYVSALDRDKRSLQREFRSNLKTIAAAVADFNAHNMSKPGPPAPRGQRFDAVRPTHSDLQTRLGITGDDAHALRESWNQAHAAWRASCVALTRLPWCLCHNDVSPGNSTYTDGVLTLADFGLAAGGPVGTDLHTLMRWSGEAITDPVHVDALLAAYVGRMRAYDRSVSLEDVRLAAWATFFLRYTNLKFSSARYLNTYKLAIQRMIEVSDVDSAPLR